jgi:hypothetical protein
MTPRGERRTHRYRGVLVALVAGLALVGQTPASVQGDHGGRDIGSLFACDRPVLPPRCLSVGNDHRHYVHLDDGMPDELAAALRDAIATDYDARTNLTVVAQPRIDARTDVIAYANDYGDNGAAGWVYCPPEAPQGESPQGDRWCQRQELYLNLNARFGAYFADDGSRAHVACHELGHTLGLRHWGNPPDTAGPAAATCMNGDSPDGPTDLHQIDIDHINAYYARPKAQPRRDPYDFVVERPAHADEALSAWSQTLVAASEVEHYGSLDEMAAAADAVVVGRITAIRAGRLFGVPGRSSLQYAAATVRIDQLLAASPATPLAAGTELTLEIPLYAGAGSLPQLRDALAATEGLFFLRRKTDAPDEAGVYRLVTMRGLVLDDGGRAVTLPGEDDFIAALDGLSFDEVARRVGQTVPPIRTRMAYAS